MKGVMRLELLEVDPQSGKRRREGTRKARLESLARIIDSPTPAAVVFIDVSSAIELCTS